MADPFAEDVQKFEKLSNQELLDLFWNIRDKGLNTLNQRQSVEYTAVLDVLSRRNEQARVLLETFGFPLPVRVPGLSPFIRPTPIAPQPRALNPGGGTTPPPMPGVIGAPTPASSGPVGPSVSPSGQVVPGQPTLPGVIGAPVGKQPRPRPTPRGATPDQVIVQLIKDP